MQGKYILPVLIFLLIILPPAAASTNQITAGAPVFIGETNIDLTKALDNCRIIAWWPEGSTKEFPAAKNITLRPLNEVSSVMSKYTFSPAQYHNYTGTWYCEEHQPFKPVFIVKEPEVKIRAWDVSNDTDVTGTTVPSSANVTYRIDTNLDSVLQVKYRPDLNPADGFWTVTLTDPYGRKITNIYTGSYGAKDTVILTLDSSPYITATPYYWNFWKTGGTWNRASRNTQGELVYPPGTYTFTVSQNLHNMQDTYRAAGIADTDGHLTSSATITFAQAAAPVTTTAPPLSPERTEAVVTTAVAPDATMPPLPPTTVLPATTPVPSKTTYQPLPAWLALAGIGIAAVAISCRRR